MIPQFRTSSSAEAAPTLARGVRLEKWPSRPGDSEEQRRRAGGILPETPEGEADEDEAKGQSVSALELRFREAEVIGRNLKESGTRR